MCQNGTLATTPNINIGVKTIVNKYINNPITKSIVCGGLEPFDTFDDLLQLIAYLRVSTDDDIVIYTGYNQSEITWKIAKLKKFKNIIVKFGRYKPNRPSRFDNLIGVYLASPNQYAKIIS